MSLCNACVGQFNQEENVLVGSGDFGIHYDSFEGNFL
jgi:hypothetical protein